MYKFELQDGKVVLRNPGSVQNSEAGLAAFRSYAADLLGKDVVDVVEADLVQILSTRGGRITFPL
jgi:hypothetical protein